jgi:hypothetical protein
MHTHAHKHTHTYNLVVHCSANTLYDNEKENCRILTNKEIYASAKKTYYNRDNKVRLD